MRKQKLFFLACCAALLALPLKEALNAKDVNNSAKQPAGTPAYKTLSRQRATTSDKAEFSKAIRTLSSLQFKQFSSANGLPCDEVGAVHQGREGYMWIGTRLGLFQYDGYQTKTYKNNLQHPHLLTSDNVTNLADDNHDHLWIGTDHGLNRLDHRTGRIRQYHFGEFDNCDMVDCLLQTSNGSLWLGTDGGLYRYDAQRDSFIFTCNIRHNSIVPHCSIKSLCEDSRGYLWIGTWDKGLFRYNLHNRHWYQMPKFNDANSAQVVYQDSRQRLWVGTWGGGLYLIHNPYDTGRPLRFTNFFGHGKPSELISNFIYSMAEDPATSTLWIGTRRGLSIQSLDEAVSGTFTNYPNEGTPELSYMSRGVSSLFCDNGGRMWMCNVGGGAISTSTRPRYFSNYSLSPTIPPDKMDVIRCLTSDGTGGLLIGLTEYGIVHHNLTESPAQITNGIMASAGMTDFSEINAIFRRRDGSMFIGTRRFGFFQSKTGAKTVNYNKDNTPWLTDNCINTFVEDKMGRLLIGYWAGLCVLDGDNTGHNIGSAGGLDLSQIRVVGILHSKADEYWLSTHNSGIIRLRGNLDQPQTMMATVYKYANAKGAMPAVQGTSYNMQAASQLSLGPIVKMLKDSHGRIWACSQETGLLLYDEKADAFRPMNQAYAIPGDNVSSMEEDPHGDLWLSTNYGLVRLNVAADNRRAELRIFSTLDGLPGNYFGNAISCNLGGGRLCFGNFGTFTVFNTSAIRDVKGWHSACITDIKIFNQSLGDLDGSTLADITTLLPPYTSKITLQPSQNDLTLEFSTLTYDNPQATRFAYKMEGYDHDWVYADAGRHAAYYSNLPSGTYTFRLKATDATGVWTENQQTLTVVVLPPMWLRWWAFVIYTLLVGLAVYLSFQFMRRREQQRQEIRLAHLENEKVEELNHNKLQFFTNITHDLMTPLTIISAVVEETKKNLESHTTEADSGNNGAIQGSESSTQNFTKSLSLIQTNVNRLMRLLGQILEFRKAETGNLHLRVSRADLADFCLRETESIAPLMKSKKLHLSAVCDPEHIVCYFDSDVVDKVIYNLLSNAAKYNRPMGFVQLNLAYGADHDHVVLTVRDNGQGIPADSQKTLFQRFYEGEHRRFNTYGTGIGLSLTRDLVTLHQGTIAVESEEGKGTTFTVTLPVSTSYFKEEEVDDNPDTLVITSAMPTAPASEENASSQESDSNERETLLLVEDNEELLALMKRLLQREYRILTASDGREALAVVENEERVDLIISDIMMPEMDGIELTRNLKNRLETSHIPIILLTAKRTDEDKTEAYNVGADAYITKPFQLSLLDARIRNLLKKRERAARDFKKKLVVELSDFELTNLDEEFLRHCVSCIQKHIADADFDQQQFADEVGTSKSTLYKKLKSLTGLNTPAFIRNIRMKTACSMAEQNPTLRISELAYAVGYNDPKYFSSCFKKDLGLLPSEYMERFTRQENGGAPEAGNQ